MALKGSPTGRGRLPATGVTLRAVVDPRLAYLDDSSGVTPVVSGNVLTWHLSDLRLYDIREFTIRLQNVGGEPGENLTVQLELHADQPDLQPAANSVSVSLQLYVPVYLSLLTR